MTIVSTLLIPGTIRQAQAAAISDSSGDFLSTFTGPHNADLDVISAEASFDGSSFKFSSQQNGAIGTTANALFVWGVDRGTHTAGFGSFRPGVLFDAVVILRPDGTGNVLDLTTNPPPSANLPAGAVTVTGSTIQGVVPMSLLPSKGAAPAQYGVNLWPRTGLNDNTLVADFAPDNSDASVTLAQGGPSTSAAPSNVQIHSGYSMTAFATGLNSLTAVAISQDKMWVAEAGFLPNVTPAIKEIDSSGNAKTILTGSDVTGLAGPLTDVVFSNGWLWITHRQTGANGWLVGAISKFQPQDPKGTFTTVLTNLPSAGDHYTEEIAFDASGRAYFSQGSATNSSVAGADNSDWIKMPATQTFHDFAPKDIVLSAVGYKTGAPFPLDPDASKTTAPYMPFGSGAVPAGTAIPAATPTTPQQGMIAGNGAVYSFDPNAPNPAMTMRLEAWGFRNPYGIRFDPLQPGALFVSNNGSDYRKATVNGKLQIVESRPVDNDLDDLFIVQTNGGDQFFGWPDFFHSPQTGAPVPATDPQFCVDEPAVNPCPQFVFDNNFRNSLKVLPAFSELEYHSSANKFDFSTDQGFRFVCDIFIAETGSLPPGTGADDFVGFKVVRVDRSTGKPEDFIAHTKHFGALEPTLDLMTPNSGKIWAVTATSP